MNACGCVWEGAPVDLFMRALSVSAFYALVYDSAFL